MRKFDHNAISNKDIYFNETEILDQYEDDSRRRNIKSPESEELTRNNTNSSKLILNIKTPDINKHNNMAQERSISPIEANSSQSPP